MFAAFYKDVGAEYKHIVHPYGCQAISYSSSKIIKQKEIYRPAE